MPNLLESKTVIVLGVWNKWSIAYAIAQACIREGATVLLTYQNERAKPTVEELGKELGATHFYPCDVQQQSDIDDVAASVKHDGHKLDAARPLPRVRQSRRLEPPVPRNLSRWIQLALDVSAFSLVAISKALSPLMTDGGAIMTLTYLGSTRVVKNYNVMGIAKAALEAEVRYLAAELGAQENSRQCHFRRPDQNHFRPRHQRLFKGSRFRAGTFPAAAQYRHRRSRRHRGFPGQRSGPRGHRQCIYVDAGFQIMGLEPPVPPKAISTHQAAIGHCARYLSES